ncbi:hypothetical protein [Actinomyces bowdenii]|uniref:Uncharacterized protein n=1 Tax=Actinomyces bowdenii TaxID=131109 RepID=A0A853EFZ5_9ACTO|nr:hypothetical protein [Actinomyces bowdenii]MBF0696095.1 hypothetical protein [Actinomyces bowdenii]MCR2052006.1 hypothetical protein [Actinomyces bowdenii]NYS68268.1 hypothetical protein [Actinomyces bowdenii]
MPSTGVGLTVDIAAGIIGAAGLLLAALANKRAKDANRHAQIANDLAAQGIAQAEEANRVAVEGNQIADDANTLAERALAATTDNVDYQWRLKVQEDGLALVVLNDSAHPAHDVTITVDQDSHVKATASADHVAAFGEVLLDLEGLVQQEIEHARGKAQRLDAFNASDNGAFIVGRPHSFRLRLTVVARTEAGVPRSDVIEKRFSVSKGRLKTTRRRN